MRLEVGLGVNFLATKTGTSQDTVEGSVGGVVTWGHGTDGKREPYHTTPDVGRGQMPGAALGLNGSANLTCQGTGYRAQGKGQRANKGMG